MDEDCARPGVADAVASGLGTTLTPFIRTVASAVEAPKQTSEDDKKLSLGTLAYLRTNVRLLVHLARDCDTLDIKLRPGLLGREPMEGLRRAGDSVRVLLASSGWPCLVLNRHAYGFAAAAWGGRDVASLPEHDLAAAVFPQCDVEAFDEFRPPPPREGNGRIGLGNRKRWLPGPGALEINARLLGWSTARNTPSNVLRLGIRSWRGVKTTSTKTCELRCSTCGKSFGVTGGRSWRNCLEVLGGDGP